MTEKDLIQVSSFTVTSADTDIQARLRPGSLVNFLLQSAIRSAEVLGFGFEVLLKQQLFWVLSSLTIEFTRPLMWNERIEVETWPKDLFKSLYLRDYIVRDENGEIVGRAASGWFAIDHQNHRPNRIAGDNPGIFDLLKGRSAIHGYPEKLDPVREGKYTEITSGYFDIDLNKHVTSTRYIDWMMDTIPVDYHLSHYPKHMTINYLKEIHPGEKILITSGDKDACFHFDGAVAKKDASAFRGRICF